MKEEKLLREKQKVIIDKIVEHLSAQGFSMYYESTINVCHEIHNIIHQEQLLNNAEKEVVIDLEPKDIQILLSYKSSCC